MRFSVLAIISLFAASTAATSIRRQYPTCAQSCLANADTGNCASGNNDCLCHNSNFIQSTFGCIETSCQGTDLAQAISVSYQFCLASGVTISSAIGAEFSATASLGKSSSAAAPASTTSNAPAAASSTAPASSPSPSSSVSSPSPSPTGGAVSVTGNTALVGLVAIVAVALAL
ncbi:unnamed protein product [Mycena citricolor]|uniref:CFEM domain-containing protein n=1 Tax=Mycena citricolor TaxID=2018698 RepID=A0AAD2K494_9AGAR|nr:unnamed protein product [Mycena citricolor]